MAQEIEIKITGSGTKEQIIESLEEMIKSIRSTDDEILLQGRIAFEDETLCAEIR